MARFLVGILIGVGGTLAWQSHGEEAKRIVGPWVAETVMRHAPTVAWALPGWAKPPQAGTEGQTGSTPTRQGVVTEIATAPPPSPVVEIPTVPPANSNDPGVTRRLTAMEGNLDILRRSVDQLAETERQLAQSVATLQAELGQKLSTLQAEIGKKLAAPPVAAVATPVEQGATTGRRAQPAPPRAARARRTPPPPR